jgi:hypothetical protein
LKDFNGMVKIRVSSPMENMFLGNFIVIKMGKLHKFNNMMGKKGVNKNGI